jgi:hypothetical protein
MKIKIVASVAALVFSFNSPLMAQELPQAVTAKKEMVVSANPLASEAGARILRRGGTAADAMVAVQTVLGLVEPQSSGIGGGAFVVYYDASTGTTTTIDAREKAPARLAKRPVCRGARYPAHDGICAPAFRQIEMAQTFQVSHPACGKRLSVNPAHQRSGRGPVVFKSLL